MNKEELEALYELHYGAAKGLSDGFEGTGFQELDIGEVPQFHSKFEIKRGISYLSRIIADEIGGEPIDIYDHEKVEQIYDSETISLNRDVAYLIEVEDEGTIKIGEAADKEWKVMERISEGETLDGAVKEVMSGNSPKSGLRMHEWEVLLDQEGQIKEKYRSDLSEMLQTLDQKEGVLDYDAGLESLRPPYARPGIVDALDNTELSRFNSRQLDTATNNRKVGMLLSDLEKAGIVETRGSKYEVVKQDRIDELREAVSDLYRDRIEDVLDDFGFEEVFEEVDEGISTRNAGSEGRELEGDLRRYNDQFLNFMDTLGVIDPETLELTADEIDIRFIEQTLESQQESRNEKLSVEASE